MTEAQLVEARVHKFIGVRARLFCTEHQGREVIPF